jgi:formamidopyrimidine-DNA glycosylase
MIEKKPFTRMHEKKKHDTFTVRVNEEERLMIDSAKVLLDLESDSTTLKVLATVGLNVLNTTFSSKTLKYLTSAKRNRLSETIEFKEDLKKNVLQNLKEM